MAQQLTKQIVVRVEPDLHEALARDATEHGRTVAQSVRHLLRAAVVRVAGARPLPGGGINTAGCRSMAADPDEGAVRWALRCACDDVDRLRGLLDWVRQTAADGSTMLDPNLAAALAEEGRTATAPMPHHLAVTIGSLVRLVQISDCWQKAGTSSIVYALNDDDLAALNACFGADWGDRNLSWESDHPISRTIREMGEADDDA